MRHADLIDCTGCYDLEVTADERSSQRVERKDELGKKLLLLFAVVQQITRMSSS